MKINKESWHFKLIQFVYGEHKKPKTLCSYFWNLVFSPLLLLLLIIFNIIFIPIILFLYLTGAKISKLKLNIKEGPDCKVNYNQKIWGRIRFYLLSFFLIYYLIDYFYLIYINGNIYDMAGSIILLVVIFLSSLALTFIFTKDTSSKTVNIFVEYIKAKKKGICPILEY